jgi:hypothetical protein
MIDEPDVPGGTVAVAPPPETRPPKVRTRPGSSMLDPAIVHRALIDAFVKLDPRQMLRAPGMFTVEVGSLATTIAFLVRPSAFVLSIALWLWETVLFANFAEAVAEGARPRPTPCVVPARRPWPLSEDRTARSTGSRPASCRSATSVSSRPAGSSPATATLSRGSPRSTSRRSPASRLRCSVSRAGTAAR